MIRKLKSGEYRIYSRKVDPKTHKRKNLGTFSSLEAAKKHEKEIQYFKHHWEPGWRTKSAAADALWRNGSNYSYAKAIAKYMW